MSEKKFRIVTALNKEDQLRIDTYLLVCVDHDDEVIEFWKYDSIDDTDHSHCNTRACTPEELMAYLSDPEEEECINENFLSSLQTKRAMNLRFMKEMMNYA